MTISYNWLCNYLPEKPLPEALSKILTAIGLEVESLELKESIKGGLKGLVTGEVLTCEKHPDADKLKLTTVNTGNGTALQIVCGAANVAAGQKVIVAVAGTCIYPLAGEPFVIKKTKIRGIVSEGMICAEDEIGLGESHDGIIVLPAGTEVGKPAASLYHLSSDYIFEIGLTPNRMDAMSHLGVARDVCAYLTHHNRKEVKPKLPYNPSFAPDSDATTISISIENNVDCKRYAGLYLQNITVGESPDWLKQKLQSINVKSINNIVDITNFILHETGQPLHAFDADKINGKSIIVKSAKEGEKFITLDGSERKLKANDLVICDAQGPLCIAGVYGGLNSGVGNSTKNIFLESAWFSPGAIRKTSVVHGLRTDAATRFEKGVDISNTVLVLKRAAELIKQVSGATIGAVTDIYPQPVENTIVQLKYHYLKKLSGKNYHSEAVKNILMALGIDVFKDASDELWVQVPYHKPDITLPADLVEEIMRIDGLDNIEIPAAITITPSAELGAEKMAFKEKTANYLTGLGFREIFTNSITNSHYYTAAELDTAVKLKNSLSAGLDIMRPSMLETGLEVMAYNINRKMQRLKFYEFGKTYSSAEMGKYTERNHLALYISGELAETGWQHKSPKVDFYYVKAVAEKIMTLTGAKRVSYEPAEAPGFDEYILIKQKNTVLGSAGKISAAKAEAHHISESVFYAGVNWDEILTLLQTNKIIYRAIPKFPAVERDLALLVDKQIAYHELEKAVAEANINRLVSVKLFDVFESEKLGNNKKSMAVNFTFCDETKTLTDAEVEEMMHQITGLYEQKLGAEVRKK